MQESYLHELLKVDDQEIRLTEKQAHILAAAIEIFAEKGYAATATSEIAKRAGVAEGTIFRHYPAKKDLLLAIVKPGVLKFAVPVFASNMVEHIFNREFDGFEDLLSVFIYNRLDFARQNVAILRIVLQEFAFHPEIKKTVEESFLEQVYPKIKETITGFQKAGRLKQMPLKTMVRCIVSPILGFIITRFILNPDAEWDEEQEVDNIISFIMKGIEAEA
ncbi:TetR/AcrR family transcriptional regulator [Virgibacillus senegalensis]|uniref:TetR/AcrR family transcriptional regulator n=1 Tax=Virgibacillus senegalensis TaxID=1499679 RepID=UPI00069DAB7D|nr:TetR/AcrR family transcriptional regulator [Virgibacillus senegalensis]